MWRDGLLRSARNDGEASDVLRTNRLDIVAVGIDQERGVIGRAVIGARPGAAIVATAGFQAFGVELLDRGVIPGAERDMLWKAEADPGCTRGMYSGESFLQVNF